MRLLTRLRRCRRTRAPASGSCSQYLGQAAASVELGSVTLTAGHLPGSRGASSAAKGPCRLPAHRRRPGRADAGCVRRIRMKRCEQAPSGASSPGYAVAVAQSAGRRRIAFTSLRRFLPASLRSFEPRVGFVGLRFGAGGRNASVSSSASRTRAASRLRCCDRYSDAVDGHPPSVRRWFSRASARDRRCSGTDGEPAEVEGELHPAVGRVHRLPAGTARPAETPRQLGFRDRHWLRAAAPHRSAHGRDSRGVLLQDGVRLRADLRDAPAAASIARLGTAHQEARRQGVAGAGDVADRAGTGARWSPTPSITNVAAGRPLLEHQTPSPRRRTQAPPRRRSVVAVGRWSPPTRLVREHHRRAQRLPQARGTARRRTRGSSRADDRSTATRVPASRAVAATSRIGFGSGARSSA